MSVENLELNLENYINEPAVDIRTVEAGQRYFIVNDVTNPSAELCGIVLTITDGTAYATGGGLEVQYELTGDHVDLFPGGDVVDPNTESSTHQKLYNIKHVMPGAGLKRKPRRSQKNKSKSKSKSKSKKGISRKNRKSGRR